jgi:hypothetical protein
VVHAFDGIMVARGDLGVELPLERVPLVQKRAVQLCRENAKPVIMATQMLDSMMVNPRPTRAEVSDVANAVLDGADAVMLSGETSVGDYPIETVRTMARIIEEVEFDPVVAVPPLRQADRTQPSLLSHAARDIADGRDAKALVAFTLSGNTVRRLARLHPRRPLIAITPVAAGPEPAGDELGDACAARAGCPVSGGDGVAGRPGSAGDGRVRPRRRGGDRDRRAAPHDRPARPPAGVPISASFLNEGVN